MNSEKWKEKVYKTAYAAVWRQNFGHKCNLEVKAESLINEVVKEFLVVYPFSRRYETRKFNRDNNTKNGTFIDFISHDETLRSIFYNRLIDKIGGEYNNDGTSLSNVVEPLARKRHDKSKGYNATLRLVYKRMPVSWKNRITRSSGETKQNLILRDPKLQKMFRNTVNAMLEEINA